MAIFWSKVGVAMQSALATAVTIDAISKADPALVEYTDADGKSHRRIQTQQALCKGCGICAATCPKEGVVVNGFTPGQLKAQVDAILEQA